MRNCFRHKKLTTWGFWTFGLWLPVVYLFSNSRIVLWENNPFLLNQITVISVHSIIIHATKEQIHYFVYMKHKQKWRSDSNATYLLKADSVTYMKNLHEFRASYSKDDKFNSLCISLVWVYSSTGSPFGYLFCHLRSCFEGKTPEI